MRLVLFENAAFEDLQFWSKNELKLLKKIIELIADIQKTPFTGIGKPEGLKHELKLLKKIIELIADIQNTFYRNW